MKEKQSFGGTGGSEKTEYRVIVAGSREFEQYSIVTKELDHFLSSLPSAGKITIVVGGCRGADALGERYAYEHDYDLQVFPAEWEKYGKSAGPIRNRSMAKYAASDHAKGVLFAFWDGVSRGTQNMIQHAKDFRLEVHVIPIPSIQRSLPNASKQNPPLQGAFFKKAY